MEVQKHSVHTLVFRSLKRTHDMFLADQANPPPPNERSDKLKMMLKAQDEYGSVLHLVKNKKVGMDDDEDLQMNNPKREGNEGPNFERRISTLGEFEGRELYETDAPPPGMEDMFPAPTPAASPSQALVLAGAQQQALTMRRMPSIPKPQWHPPWKLYRVVSGILQFDIYNVSHMWLTGPKRGHTCQSHMTDVVQKVLNICHKQTLCNRFNIRNILLHFVLAMVSFPRSKTRYCYICKVAKCSTLSRIRDCH